jgi:ribonuclease III
MHASSSINTAELEGLIGYCFSDKALLVEALTHTSFQYENSGAQTAHYERLEFLGDSVLGLVIAEALFVGEHTLSEAGMSKIKSYLVNKSMLYEIAAGLSLGRFIRLGRGEESTGGRQKRSILSDTIEAILGAVYLDSDYGAARALILRLYAGRIGEAISGREGYDFKSELQELTQAMFGVLPEYRTVRQEGAEHKKIFTVEVYINDMKLGTGSGKSKKEAQIAAAGEALESMKASRTGN